MEINPKQLAAFMRQKPTLADTAAFFECSERTIERYIKDNFQLTFVEFREQKMVHTRHGLIRKALEMAMNGDRTMLIFSLKNLCGWADKQDLNIGDNQMSITMNYERKKKNPSAE